MGAMLSAVPTLRTVFQARLALLVALVLSLLGGPVGTQASAAVAPVTIADYTNPAQDIAWGQRSHWKQPWRSYSDTVPATTFLNAIGINFNVSLKAAEATARLLGEAGFKRARIEVGWNSLDYENPGTMKESSRNSLHTLLGALQENGIRPLILLNANHGEPCPVKRDALRLTAPAATGATTIQIAPEDVGKVKPGRTGISVNGIAAKQLITAVDPDGTARMSMPLKASYPAGELKIVTLRYEPFRSPTLQDGSPNPAFGPTMLGWLNYVGVVTREAKSVLGSDRFDVEVWNELSFGSDFLEINRYYGPAVEWRDRGPTAAILKRTVQYLRDPANGVPGVGIGNGFANQRPWDNGTQSPIGLTAIDKHPYAGWEPFPGAAQINGIRPLNGLGELEGWADGEGQWHESFTPSYDAFFPERPLSALHTETLVHDLSPYPSLVNHVEHGRLTHSDGGSPPTMWITEVNLDPASGPVRATAMTTRDVRHIATKNALRYLTAYVNKGVTALHFYAANAGNLSLVDPAFFTALKAAPSVYPGEAAGGETMAAVRRLTESMGGAKPIGSRRALSLNELTDYSSNVQFAGNPADLLHHPPLYNRDVFAFLPFQVSASRFVIPVYVMTRNVARVYRPDASDDPTRFDLPPERYRLAIGGVDGVDAEVTATDPLTGESVPVEVVSATGSELTVELPVTDSPRLLTIQETSAGTEPPAEEPPIEEPPAEEEPSEGEPPAEEEPAEENEEPTEGEPAEGKPHADEEPPVEGNGSVRPPARGDQEEARTTPSSPQIELRGTRALLRRQRMTLVAHCEAGCDLRVHGQLAIGSRRYAMRGSESRTALSSPAKESITLSISSSVARLGRLAIRRGSRVAVVVTTNARQDALTQPIRRVQKLRR
jgi:hypothetical protein